MTNFKKPNFVAFGPPVPVVPIPDFSKMGLTIEQFEAAWSIVGPSVEKNMRRNFKGQCLELWQVITVAYLEGLHHGSEIAKANP